MSSESDQKLFRKGISGELKASLPLTKRALGLAKADVSDDWDYKDLLADELVGKYSES